MIEVIDPIGARWTYEYGNLYTKVKNPNGSYEEYFFDENYRTKTKIRGDGVRESKVWGDGQLKQILVEHGGITKFTHDANGNVTSIRKPQDPSPRYVTYDPSFNKPTLIQPIVGAPTSIALNSQTGDVQTVSRGGLSLQYTHDQFGGITSINNGRTTYAFQRNADGFLTMTPDLHNPEVRGYDNRGRLQSRLFGTGRQLQYSYDDYNRTISVVDSHGPDTSFEYDEADRLKKKTVSAGGVNQVTSYTYDSADRIVTTKDALNRVTTFVYDTERFRPQPKKLVDPAGRETQFEYDLLDRLVKKTDAVGAVTAFTYDSRGNLTSVTDANGNVTSYSYDHNDRKVREIRPSIIGTSPLRRVQQFFYDGADRLVREVTKSGSSSGRDRVISYEYNEIDRLIEKKSLTEGQGQSGIDDISVFSYEDQLDATSLKTATNGVSQLGFSNEASPPFLISSYSVNATQPGNPMQLLEGTYSLLRDPTGEISSVARNGVSLFSKSYDSAGRLEHVGSGSFESTLAYDEFGRRQTATHSSGESGAIQYDLLNRVTSINWSGSTPASEQLQYNIAGNIDQLTREGSVSQIGYDAVDQVLSASSTGQVGVPQYNRSWTYDHLGNRLQDSVNGAGTFTSNFLVSNGVSSFLADPHGFGETIQETTGSAVKNYFYRADGLLNGVQIGPMQAAYYYDALGRRVAKVINDGSSTSKISFAHLAGENRVLLGKAADGSVTTYVDGQGIDDHLGEVKAGVGKGYVTDHLGSVLNGDAAGASHRFGLFGEPTGGAKAFTPRSSNPVNYGYTGREWDTESGLNYHRARYYNPSNGRWLSQDPIGLEGDDSNYYRFVRNGSTRYTDPEGLRDVMPEFSDIYDSTEAYILGIEQYTKENSLSPSNEMSMAQHYALQLRLGEGPFAQKNECTGDKIDSSDTSEAAANAQHYFKARRMTGEDSDEMFGPMDRQVAPTFVVGYQAYKRGAKALGFEKNASDPSDAQQYFGLRGAADGERSRRAR